MGEGGAAASPPGDIDETEGCQAPLLVSNFNTKFCILHLIYNFHSKLIFMSGSAGTYGWKDGNAQHTEDEADRAHLVLTHSLRDA